jgi:hypothetical protein
VQSPYRVVLDWCDAACNAGTANRTEPMITIARNGDVTFTRVFFRNFLPTSPMPAQPYEDPQSPVPGIVCKDRGLVTFRLVVWHFMKQNLYAFDATSSPYPYWVSAPHCSGSTGRGAPCRRA